MFDETTDLSHVSQMSLVFRYVFNDKIKENFIEFIDCHREAYGKIDDSEDVEPKLSGEHLGQIVIDLLNKFSLNLHDCIGITTDGCSVMISKARGAVQHIQKFAKNAIYSPCANHSLNLCISKSSTVQFVRNSVGVIKEVVAFFNSSSKRNFVLKSTLKNHSLKNVCETRWIDRHDSILLFSISFTDILIALNKISEWSESESATKAKMLISALENFYLKDFTPTKIESLTENILVEFGFLNIQKEVLRAEIELWKSKWVFEVGISCNQLRGQQQNTSMRRTGIIAVDRSCLSQSQHTKLLSTPKGWKPHGLSFIMKKCRKTDRHAINGRHCETGKHAFFNVNTSMWPHFVKQFLISAEYSLAPATRMILSKILLTRVNFSNPKWSNYRNTQTDLCRFLSDLNPNCDSINWKGDFFRTLSSLIFNYMVQVLCSGRISKKQKIAHVILKKINDVTKEYVLLNSPDNFLQGVQIFVANMLSPWLEKPINYICIKGTSNKDPLIKNLTNEIENHKVGIKTKHLKTNELAQNKTTRLKSKTAKKVNTNEKSKIKKLIKNSLLSQNYSKFTKTIKTNGKSKKSFEFTPVIAAEDELEKIIENHEILSNSDLVSHPGSKNITKMEIKNKKYDNIKSENNQKPKKIKTTKTIFKSSLSLQNSEKAIQNRKTNGKSKIGFKSMTVIAADKIINNNEMLSNSVLSNIFYDDSLRNINTLGEYTSVENGNNGSTGNEKISKSTEQLQNDNSFEAGINTSNNKKNQLIIDDDRTILTVNNRSKSHFDRDNKLLLLKHNNKPTTTISNRITDNHYYNANEDERILNATDYSSHSVIIVKDLSGEIYDINLLIGDELLKYNDKTSVEVNNDGYSDVYTDYDNGCDDDDEYHKIIMNEDGEEFETRILDNLTNVFLDTSSTGLNNKHENGVTITESRGYESKRNCFQICADGNAKKLLMDTLRNKALTKPEVCEQATGVTYNICKKDGSNYSIRKTILPQCKNRNLLCTLCPLDKSKLVVNTLIKLK
ncbi:PREDICTED: uncharacterized protein LOC107169845 [Diuraphis noxia]|uniref:uncharacterized protein LOC107169845 n=1 Tax=Diuraphis noxia TaxID=143948 RepID=UPI000763AB02|nr:PREDICTED: uncharacterized protein LOC107169845 [Diuraphis noxia]